MHPRLQGLYNFWSFLGPETHLCDISCFWKWERSSLPIPQMYPACFLVALWPGNQNTHQPNRLLQKWPLNMYSKKVWESSEPAPPHAVLWPTPPGFQSLEEYVRRKEFPPTAAICVSLEAGVDETLSLLRLNASAAFCSPEHFTVFARTCIAYKLLLNYTPMHHWQPIERSHQARHSIAGKVSLGETGSTGEKQLQGIGLSQVGLSHSSCWQCYPCSKQRHGQACYSNPFDLVSRVCIPRTEK